MIYSNHDITTADISALETEGEKDMKKTNNTETGLIIARAAAITVLAIYFAILAYGWISGNRIPDAGMRFLGIVDLIALPAAVFTSVRLHMIRKSK